MKKKLKCKWFWCIIRHGRDVNQYRFRHLRCFSLSSTHVALSLKAKSPESFKTFINYQLCLVRNVSKMRMFTLISPLEIFSWFLVQIWKASLFKMGSVNFSLNNVQYISNKLCQLEYQMLECFGISQNIFLYELDMDYKILSMFKVL